jgi:carbon monoxide dehydrogenase subunit G
MKFEHTIRIDAPKAKVDAFLEDFQRSALCLPGVEEVKDLGNGEWEGRIRVRVGPLGFNIGGLARPERGADGSWIVHGEGKDRRVAAGVKAAMIANLIELSPNSTEVKVNADVTFSGTLAGLGQPLIKKKADAMVQEFASNLQKAIAKE